VLSDSLFGVLTALFFFFLSFEFAITTALSLFTELMPGARATLMAANVAAMAGGDALGAAAGPWLFRWGLPANVAAATLFNVAALGLLAVFLRTEQADERRQRSLA
jgi:predicted MFS family arabinose efflux permease